jgi:MinD superfamily P-loop ATPase
MKEIVVLSGKGGTGKTSVTAALAGLGPAKVLADCDVDAADLHLILAPSVLHQEPFIAGELAEIDPELCTSCGLCRDGCRFDAISENFQVIAEHCEGCGLCEFVCPVQAVIMHPRRCGDWYKSRTRFGTMIHAALDIGAENSGKLVTTVRRKSQEQAETEGVNLILTDGPPGIGCPAIASLTGADMVLLVAEPTVTAVHDLKRIVELTRHFKIDTAVVINKADLHPQLEQEIRAFCKASGLDVLGRLPYVDTFTLAQIKGQSVVEFDPDGLGKLFESLWNNLEKHLQGVDNS